MELANTNQPTTPPTKLSGPLFFKKISDGSYQVVSGDANQHPPGTLLTDLTNVSDATIVDILQPQISPDNTMASMMEFLTSSHSSTSAIVLGIATGVITAMAYGFNNMLPENGVKISLVLIGIGSLGKAYDFLSR